MKLFQYDKKTWDNGEVNRTWQFGIIRNRALLWVSYETPPALTHASGGLHILISLFTCYSLLGVNFQHNKFGLAFNLFCDYFDGWSDD